MVVLNDRLKAALGYKGLKDNEIANLAKNLTDDLVKMNLSVKEAVKFTNLSERTLYQLAEDGIIDRVKIGRRVLYPLRHLQEVREGTIKVVS